MSGNPQKLYDICISVAVSDCVTVCKFCKKEFRALPNNVLFDFYYKMFTEKRLCLLAVEFGELEVFNRLISVKHQRMKLLKCFQQLVDHGSKVPEELLSSYVNFSGISKLEHIDIGLKISQFLSDGGWFIYAIKFLDNTEDICLKEKEDVDILKRLLDLYHKRIYAESCFCAFKAAKETFDDAQTILKKLEKLNSLPNLAALYANFSVLYFCRSEYDEAFSWAKKSLDLLTEDLPTRVLIDVLRQTSKSCVVKRRFGQAGLLIRQAVNIASKQYALDLHPHFSETLADYGFYLLNFDSIEESVKVYERSLAIKKEVFEKNNVHVALGHEDMAYAQYVNEYSSGRFYFAKENAERSLRIMERLLPPNHFLLSSVKRVKALILEEIALDLREGNSNDVQNHYLFEAEELHKEALELSLEAFGEKNVQTAKHYGNLGRLYQSMKRYDEAEEMHLRAIAIKEELLGERDYEVGLSVGHLASLYNYHMKRIRDAEKLYLRSVEINLNLFGEAYSGLEYDYRGLISIYENLLDPTNVLIYSQKMREWKKLREQMKPVVHNEELQPLKDIIKKFADMN